MISQSTIAEVKDRANLVEIISETVTLKRAGSSFMGLCPFHSEKSPSFHVRDGSGSYHCFGCGASGNVISFVMEMRGLSFPDAVEELAARYGIEVKREGGRQPQAPTAHKDELYKITQAAQSYFREQLRACQDSRVKSYIQKRGLRDETIEEFGLGFSPLHWTGLTERLTAIGISPELMLASGLVRRNPRGELFDLFRGRLTFPVKIESRKIAGFGGRVIPGLLEPEKEKSSPKYLNSPESEIYQKNKILYGLPHALESIRRTKEAFLVEGYVDVIGLWQVGVRRALAPCGTAVSESHVKRLQHLVEKIVVLFDGDLAGRNAAARCFELFLNSGVDVAAVFLPEDEDPDTIAVRHGEQTEQYLRDLPRVSLLDAFIDGQLQKLDIREIKELGAAAKGKIADEVSGLLARVRNAVEQSELLQRAALRLMVEPSVLQGMVLGSSEIKTTETAKPPSLETSKPKSVGPTPFSGLPRLDRELLYAVMAGRERFAEATLRDPQLCEALEPETLGFIQEFWAILTDTELPEAQQKEQLKAYLKSLGDSWVQNWKQAYEMRESADADFEQVFRECQRHSRKVKLKQALSEIDRRAAEAETEAVKASLAQEKIALKREVEKLNAASLEPGPR